jgi:hypothetical protein
MDHETTTASRSMGRRDRSETREVVVISWREREEVVEVFTNCATWRPSRGDGHTMALNRGDWWCSDREMVPDMRRRDWSQGHTFYRAVVRQKAGGQEGGGSGCGTSMVLVTGDGNREGEMMRCDRFRMEEREEARRLHGVEGE